MCTLSTKKLEFTNARAGNPPRKVDTKKSAKLLVTCMRPRIYAAARLLSSPHGTSFASYVLSCAPRVPEDDVQAREADGGVCGSGLRGGGPRLPLPLLSPPLHPHLQLPHVEGKAVRKTGCGGGGGGWQRGQLKECSYLPVLF
jgi:hypothetical protein